MDTRLGQLTAALLALISPLLPWYHLSLPGIKYYIGLVDFYNHLQDLPIWVSEIPSYNNGSQTFKVSLALASLESLLLLTLTLIGLGVIIALTASFKNIRNLLLIAPTLWFLALSTFIAGIRNTCGSTCISASSPGASAGISLIGPTTLIIAVIIGATGK